jgi:hypothetical protein
MTIMDTPILTLSLRRKRDLVRARQCARQVAGFLGFDRREQASIAAAVFELACLAVEKGGTGTLRFQIARDMVQVIAEPAIGLRLERPLPTGGRALADEDLSWAVREWTELAPFDTFAELRRQNQELLQLVHELQASQREVATAA